MCVLFLIFFLYSLPMMLLYILLNHDVWIPYPVDQQEVNFIIMFYYCIVLVVRR